MATYSASFNDTITGDRTLILLDMNSNRMISVTRLWINQTGTEASDQLGVIVAAKVVIGAGTFTGSLTAKCHTVGASNSNATLRLDYGFSVEGSGTETVIIEEGFNNLNGWEWQAAEDERIILNESTGLVLKLVGVPSDLTGWQAGISFIQLQ